MSNTPFRGILMATLIASACGKADSPSPGPTPSEPTQPSPEPQPQLTHDTAAEPPDVATPPSTWNALTGAITLPGGLPLRLIVKRTATGATLDIPDQHLAGAPLDEFSDTPSALRFAFQPKGAPPAARGVFVATRDADGTYRGHLEQGGMKLPLELTPSATGELTARRRPQTPTPPFPYPTHELKVAVDGGELACTLALPAGASREAPVPALVMRTGSGAQDRDETLFDHKPFLVLADALAKAGIATLRCDDRGAGASAPARPEDDLAVFRADGEKSLAALAAHEAIDPTKVGVLGHSEGALTAAELVAGPPLDTPRGPLEPAFAVLLAGPGRSGREILVHQNRELVLGQGGTREAADAVANAVDAFFSALESDDTTVVRLAEALADASIAANAGPTPPEPRETLIARFVALSREPWIRSFVKADPRPHLAKAKVPVLALFGAKDTQVPPEHAAALRESASNRVEVELIEGKNHLFQTTATGAIAEYADLEETMSPEVLDRITRWVARVLGLAPSPE